MKARRLLQLLASLAAPRGLRSFGCPRRRSSALRRPAARLGSLPASSDGDFESAEREDAPVRRDGDGGGGSSNNRRSVLHAAGLSLAGSVSSGPLAALLRVLPFADEDVVGGVGRRAANAMGLVQFPCPPGTLSNAYHLMRAGQSGLEAEGVLSTNPLFLTNREDKLTDLGTVQVEMVRMRSDRLGNYLFVHERGTNAYRFLSRTVFAGVQRDDGAGRQSVRREVQPGGQVHRFGERRRDADDGRPESHRPRVHVHG